MIKDIKNPKSVLVNVYLNSGEEFLGCDITSEFIHESGLWVSFWDKGVLHIFPATVINRIEAYG